MLDGPQIAIAEADQSDCETTVRLVTAVGLDAVSFARPAGLLQYADVKAVDNQGNSQFGMSDRLSRTERGVAWRLPAALLPAVAAGSGKATNFEAAYAPSRHILEARKALIAELEQRRRMAATGA